MGEAAARQRYAVTANLGSFYGGSNYLILSNIACVCSSTTTCLRALVLGVDETMLELSGRTLLKNVCPWTQRRYANEVFAYKTVARA